MKHINEKTRNIYTNMLIRELFSDDISEGDMMHLLQDGVCYIPHISTLEELFANDILNTMEEKINPFIDKNNKIETLLSKTLFDLYEKVNKWTKNDFEQYNEIIEESKIFYENLYFDIKVQSEALMKELSEIIKIVEFVMEMDTKGKKRIIIFKKRLTDFIDQTMILFKENITENNIPNYINVLNDEIEKVKNHLDTSIKNDKGNEELLDEMLNDLSIPNEFKCITNYKDLLKVAKDNGYKFDRQKSSSHAIYKKGDKILVIPDKRGDIPVGTKYSILKRIFTE